jgi:ethanolamine permease
LPSLGPHLAPPSLGDDPRHGLRRVAGIWSLWGLGVSAVISGEFFGWNYGLIAGGFGGLLIATLIIAVMYFCLCCSLAEMACALPFAGGAYAYSRLAFGPWGGFLGGLAQNVEYIFTCSVIVVAIGHYLGFILQRTLGLVLPDAALWAAIYALFVLINIHGVRLTFQVAILLSIVSMAVLVVFCIGALPHVTLANLLDVPAAPGGTRWLPAGLPGIAFAIPFAIWFLLAIEAVTVVPEETMDPVRSLPKGLLYAIATLILLAFAILILNAGAAPGARAVGTSDNPLLPVFLGFLGTAVGPVLIVVLLLSGLVASFHAGIYAFGRTLFTLGRAGYLPRMLALTHRTRRTPHWAVIAGAVIGYAVALAVRYIPAEDQVDAVLLNMSVFAAVLSYIIQMSAFLALQRNYPGLDRPYRSPLGATGAMTALVIALACLVLLFENPTYRPGLVGCVVLVLAALLYFGAYGRRRLVAAAPEEAFAVHCETARRRRSHHAPAPPAAAPEAERHG